MMLCSVSEVLTNRDLLQRIIRLGVGGDFHPDAAVPLRPGQNSNWSSCLLVDPFWKACSHFHCRLSASRPQSRDMASLVQQ